jgi:hypothetical protein
MGITFSQMVDEVRSNLQGYTLAPTIASPT